MDVSTARIPYATSLDQVYSQNQVEGFRPRWNRLLKQFSQQYGHLPDLVARSPGRVNLIGEHIDYSLYNVLPMAVSVDVLVAIRVRPASTSTATVHIRNTDESRFLSQKVKIDPEKDITIDSTKHLWTNYFMAGLVGAVSLLKKRIPGFHPDEMDILIDGNIPPGGGLSSSAAFVCASALAVMEAHKYQTTNTELLELAIVSERLVGVNSGG
jgi:galactokinase